MGSKRKSRIYAMQALFAYELGQKHTEELLSLSWVTPTALERLGADLQLFTRTIIQGTIEHKEEIDNLLTRHLEHWDFSRIGEVDRAILRVIVYEHLHIPTTPKEVLLQEAVGLASEYGTDNSYKFVNGVLHTMLMGTATTASSKGKVTLKRPQSAPNTTQSSASNKSGAKKPVVKPVAKKPVAKSVSKPRN